MKMKKKHEEKIAALKENVNRKKTACEELEEMLGNMAIIREQSVTGGGGVGISLSGNPVITPSSTSRIISYDQDTNRVVRAQAACQLGFFKSPLSPTQGTYVNEENYDSHLQQAKRKIIELENNPPQENCAIM